MKRKQVLSLGVVLAVAFVVGVAVGLDLVQRPSNAARAEEARAARVQTALGTAITYQGRLRQDSGFVNGAADFQFSLWDDESAGSQVGTTQPSCRLWSKCGPTLGLSVRPSPS
ncbi:MAG: hypothetical protein HY675_10735 [Chloroflexi bacterium]|nr:hypothetical protein [Chloroflexota bacterium]